MLGLEVVKKVADGSAVEAFLAKSSSGQVLVQVSRPELANDPELYGRFLDYTKTTTTRLRHPALLSAEMAHCASDGRFVLISGPVSGRTAEDHLREHGPLSSKEAVRWGLRICDALSYLHHHELVHGHLAPQNLYLEGPPGKPEVRLLDTGLLLFRAARSMKSVSKLVLVPPEYLSPERVSGERTDKSSDVYGVGVLLYELLTGAPPFKGGDLEETRDLQLASPMPQLPANLDAWTPVLEQCLAKSKAERFQSMDDLRLAIASLRFDATPTLDVNMSPVPSAPALGEGGNAGELRAGDVLGSYQIEGQLGEGGMGRVYLASHRTLGRKVAIKLLRGELAAHPEHLKRFTQEAQAVNKAQHPNIVQVFDFVQESKSEGGRVYFVMEVLEGQSVKAAGKAAPMELKRSVTLIRQAAEALAAAHTVGVVHRDLKPDNLFITNDSLGREVMKVLDFGVARVHDINRELPRTTQVGQVVGTPLWMAPEQVLGRDVDARADIYSLATVFYVMVARRFPFDGVSMSEVVMQRLEKEARAIGRFTFLGEAVPSKLQALIAQCLARDLAKRPATMAEVARRLAEVEAELGGESHDFPAIAPGAAAVERKPRGRWAIGALVLAGLVTLGIVGWKIVKPQPQPPAAKQLPRPAR